MQESNQTKEAVLRRGVMVFVGLLVLTGLEFWVAVSTNSLVLLTLTAGPKAILIMEYYMHIGKLGPDQEGGH